MTSSAAAAAASAPSSSAAAPLPLDAAPFLVAEAGGSQQTQYDLYELTNAFVSGVITARSLIYRADLTGGQWLPLASSHPSIAAALNTPYTAPATAVTSTAAKRWYYVDSKQNRLGPVTAELLQALHGAGIVAEETLVWHDGLTEWTPWTRAEAANQPPAAPAAAAAAADGQHTDDEMDGAGSEVEEKQSGGHAGSAAMSDSGETALAQQSQKRKKRKKPASANTAVYATGLPDDLTLDEALAFFKKAGVIREDLRTNEKRIRLYRDEQTGRGKGDATVNYMFGDSVPLALTLLDGAEIRPGCVVKVVEAKFDRATAAAQHGNSEADRAEKRNKVETMLAKRQKEVALSWLGDDSTFHSPLPPAASDSTTSSNGLRIVVLSRLFTPAEAADAADEQGSTDDYFEELTSDIGEELEARCGAVDKMTVYEHNTDGVVVVKFKSVEGAERCVKEMRGRRFGGREIGVEWWDGRDYSVKETSEEEKARLDRFATALEGEET